MAKVLPSQAELQRLFSYCKETGIVTRKVATANRVKVGDVVGSLGRGYLIVNVQSKQFPLHRVIWKLVTGESPIAQIDHIDGRRDNNAWANLRVVTNAENSRNQKRRNTNTSGAVGVGKHQGKWMATIWAEGKSHYLGSFNDFNTAVFARKEAEARYGFHANHGRVV